MGEWPKVMKVGLVEIVSHAPWCQIEKSRASFPQPAWLVLPGGEFDQRLCQCAAPCVQAVDPEKIDG